jgi:phytoene dehydrogenase-like protein
MLHHVMGGATGIRGLWGFVRGGMGGISKALASSAEAAGAVIRTGANVSRILIRGGRAYGVALENGDEISSRVVISNADPRITFLKLIEDSDLDPEFQRQVEKIRIEGCSMKINLAVDALPAFKIFADGKPGPHHKATIHVCPSMDYVDRAWEDAKHGEPSRNPLVEITIPTTYDDSLAPPGKHIISIFAQYAPYTLSTGDWDSLKDDFADRCIDAIAEYAPNFKDTIIHRQVISPLDMEREYSLTGGNIFHGDMTVDQLFFMRPVPGWARYRTPIGALYLCGSGAHPGGGVMGAPGHNSAREILSDWSGLK